MKGGTATCLSHSAFELGSGVQRKTPLCGVRSLKDRSLLKAPRSSARREVEIRPAYHARVQCESPGPRALLLPHVASGLRQDLPTSSTHQLHQARQGRAESCSTSHHAGPLPGTADAVNNGVSCLSNGFITTYECGFINTSR